MVLKVKNFHPERKNSASGFKTDKALETSLVQAVIYTSTHIHIQSENLLPQRLEQVLNGTSSEAPKEHIIIRLTNNLILTDI